jgi:hypothetical protein
VLHGADLNTKFGGAIGKVFVWTARDTTNVIDTLLSPRIGERVVGASSLAFPIIGISVINRVDWTDSDADPVEWIGKCSVRTS